MKKFIPVTFAVWTVLLVIKIVECCFCNVSLPTLLLAIGEFLFFGTCIVFLAILLWLCLRSVSIRFASLFSVGFLSFVILAECCLIIYSCHTGLLLGTDFFIRPCTEIVSAVAGFMPLWSAVLALLSLFIGMSAIFLYVARIELSKTWIYTGCAVAVLAFFSIFIKITDTELLRERNCPLIKTTHLLLARTQNDFAVQYNDEKLSQFASLFPEWNVQDLHYPLERMFEEQDALSPYFHKFTSLPHIVVIIEESFGREWVGKSKGFTPFFDSLAQTGLYWGNCLSVAPRSFAAVPAILGSVPYADNGFQFGSMPQTNGIIPILRQNNYQTEAFYGGDFAFDCMQDYLQNQHIDYLSNYYSDFKNDKSNKKEGFSWGYHDSTMFAKSLSHIQESTNNKPTFRVFITLTAHDNLMGINWAQNQKNKRYERRADSVIQLLSSSKINRDDLAPILYADECLRYFFKEYSKLKDFENTIFILTGDHASGKNMENDLSFHHVPLVIWSPKIKQSHKFCGIVSHNDVAPTLLAFLNTFHEFQMTQTSHFIGKTLDTSRSPLFNYRMPLLNAEHVYDELVFDDCFYKKSTNRLYSLNEFPMLKPLRNDSLKHKMEDVLETMEYVHKYSYKNNCVTKHPLLQEEVFEFIQDIHYEHDIVCCDSATNKSDLSLAKHIVISEKISIPRLKKIKVVISSNVLLQNVKEKDRTIIQIRLLNVNNTEIYRYSDDLRNFLSKKQGTDSVLQFYLEKTANIQTYSKKMKLEVSLSFPYEIQKQSPKIIFQNMQVSLYGIEM